MKPNQFNLRHFTSRVSTTMGRGLGVIVLSLAVFLPIASLAADGDTLYSNDDGNVTNWVEIRDACPSCSLTDDGDAQKLANTSVLCESEGVYRYSAPTWGNYDVAVATEYSAAYSNNQRVYLGVRVQGSGSFATNGYYFSCTGTSSNPAMWTPVTLTWSTTNNYASASKQGQFVVKIRGIGDSTKVEIYKDNGATLCSDFTGPSTSTYSTGGIAVGMKYTSTFATSYITFDNYLVTDRTAAPAPSSNPITVLRKRFWNNGYYW